jgi:flagellar motility protein MotE (MotC chaperone)
VHDILEDTVDSESAAHYAVATMSTSVAPTQTAAILSEEEIVALALRARSEATAIDEMAVALALRNDAARKAERRVDSLSRQVAQLEHRLAVLLQRLYGRRTEKLDPGQLLLMLEGLPATTKEATPEDAAVPPAAKRPKGHGRTAFPAHLPRVEVPPGS